MNRVFVKSSDAMSIIMMLLSLMLLCPPVSTSATSAAQDTLSAEKARLMNGEVIVVLTSLSDGVTGVSGKIYIAAPPKKVWEVLTDYNNHKSFIPKLTDSGLISDDGKEQVMFQKGRTTIIIFSRTVYIKLRVRGEYLKHLDFEEISGDFKVYKGRWIMEEYQKGQGTFLSYESEVKPDFFAPAFVVRYVQKHDFPSVLTAMKKRAESISRTTPTLH
jgi:ribosome-associated toxin RatA of RatAB toxin-antitoxin module